MAENCNFPCISQLGSWRGLCESTAKVHRQRACGLMGMVQNYRALKNSLRKEQAYV